MALVNGPRKIVMDEKLGLREELRLHELGVRMPAEHRGLVHVRWVRVNAEELLALLLVLFYLSP